MKTKEQENITRKSIKQKDLRPEHVEYAKENEGKSMQTRIFTVWSNFLEQALKIYFCENNFILKLNITVKLIFTHYNFHPALKKKLNSQYRIAGKF